MNDEREDRFRAHLRREHIKARREALAQPWPHKYFAYCGWLMDGDNGWLFTAVLLGNVALGVVLFLALGFGLTWLCMIGAGWLLWLALGVGVGIGAYRLALLLIENDRRYRE